MLRYATLSALILLVVDVHGQTNSNLARDSLTDVVEFRLEIELELNAPASQHKLVQLSELESALRSRLQDADLPVVNKSDQREELPFLWVHVNIMELDRGLVPFSIQSRFVQLVRTVLRKNFEIPASTWEESVLGLVSNDNAQVIFESAEQLLVPFIEDFRAVN